MSSTGSAIRTAPTPTLHVAKEQTHLLSRANHTDCHHDHTGWRLKKVWGIATYILLLARDAIPVIVAYCLQNSLQTVSLAIVRHLSPGNLATAAFAYMYATCTGWLVGLDGTTALDTLASSTFTGGSNRHDLGVLLQRAFFVLGLLYLPVCLLDTAKFLTLLIPGGLGYIYFEAMKKYLQAQGIMRPGTYILLTVSPLNAVLNYLCCMSLQFGLWGAPLATGLSYWLCFLSMVLYAICIDGHQCWGGWSGQMFQNLGLFTRLAILGIINVGAEWWAFEVVAIAAGWLGTIPLASQSIIMSADQVINTIPFGIGVATATRLGNLLSARDAREAARTAQAAIWLSITLGCLIMLTLFVVKDHFARIFNDDPRVVDLTAQVMPYVALFQVADGLHGSCSGFLRATGKQHVGAAINIISYYCSALPLGIWLSRNGLGLVGLWIGQCAALYTAGLAEWAIVCLSNWDKEVLRALERLDDGQGRVMYVSD